MIDDRYRSWRDRHPWLYYRTVHLLVERGLEDLAGLRRCGLDPFRRRPNVGEKVVWQLKWLIDRGEEPMPPGFRFSDSERRAMRLGRIASAVDLLRPRKRRPPGTDPVPVGDDHPRPKPRPPAAAEPKLEFRDDEPDQNRA